MTFPVNEITVLMGFASVGIVTIIGMFVYVVVDELFGRRS